jgi:hypothetical protein
MVINGVFRKLISDAMHFAPSGVREGSDRVDRLQRTPLRGFKQSGVRRELGMQALEACTELKNV